MEIYSQLVTNNDQSARPKNGGPVLMDEVQVGGPRGT